MRKENNAFVKGKIKTVINFDLQNRPIILRFFINVILLYDVDKCFVIDARTTARIHAENLFFPLYL